MEHEELQQRYKEFAELFSESIESEKNMHSFKRALHNARKEISELPNSGCFAVDISAHAFRQISERLEELALENPQIHEDVFKDNDNCMLIPSNLKSFIFTAISDAHMKGNYVEQNSKNNLNGTEYHYNIELEKWSDDSKVLRFIIIVEKGIVKTGYFNWVY